MTNTSENIKQAAKGNVEPLRQQIPSADQVKEQAQQQLQHAYDKVPKSTDDVKEVVDQAAKKSFQSLRDFVAGGVGGVCAVVVGHPFDLVKVRLQTAERGVYSGAMDVVRKTVAREGAVRGLYAGVSAPLVGVTPMFAVNFWAYGVGKQLVDNFSTVENGQYSVGQVCAAGKLAESRCTSLLH